MAKVTASGSSLIDPMVQATRRRLALWYTLVTAVLLLAFATGVYSYVRSTLVERIDDTLNHVVELVERSVHRQGSSVLDLRLLEQDLFFPPTLKLADDRVEDDHIDLEWFSTQGDLLGSTLSAPLFIPLHLSPDPQTVYLASGYGIRQLTEAIRVGDQLLGYLRVSHPWFEVTKPTRRLMIDLSLGTTAMVGAVAGVGWFLSGLAMMPIRDAYLRLKLFTADASHELRSPIASIQTNVQAVLADPDLDPEIQHTWQVVERLTRRLGKLVDNLLFLARQDSGMVQPQWQFCPMDALLMSVIEEQQAIATEKAISLKVDIITPDPPLPHHSVPTPDGDPFTLWGDEDQLCRLMTNLIGNALHYTLPNGEIQVRLELLFRHGSPHLQIQVQDTGIGIPPEALPHIYDRFYRVDQARSHPNPRRPNPSRSESEGSGLGMAIVQAIVLNHQGRITLDSRVGVGTTVSVVFPQTGSGSAFRRDLDTSRDLDMSRDLDTTSPPPF